MNQQLSIRMHNQGNAYNVGIRSVKNLELWNSTTFSRAMANVLLNYVSHNPVGQNQPSTCWWSLEVCDKVKAYNCESDKTQSSTAPNSDQNSAKRQHPRGPTRSGIVPHFVEQCPKNVEQVLKASHSSTNYGTVPKSIGAPPKSGTGTIIRDESHK